MKVKNHLLYNDDGSQVVFKKTPNIGSGTKQLLFIVLHFDAATNSTSAVNWLTQKASGVSSDLHITKSGSVTQMALFNQITWHAGASSWKGYNGLNKYSIGIEQENAGKVGGVYEGWTEVQIQKCIEVCKAVVAAYPSITEILAHSEVATPKGRKDDPGPKFPMDRVRKEVFGTTGDVDSKYTSTNVNLREGPGVNYKSLAVISNNTEVNILSSKDNWSEIFICSSKQKGWISSQYLK